jgi:UDP-GlcNAc3NAcA epimerase
MKIVTVLGARPQFIKASVISREFLKNGKHIEEVIVHTGQHYDVNMSDIFFNELNIPTPRYNLNIGGGSHGQNTGRMIESIETVLQVERPDIVLLYGDTDSTLAGAIAATKLQIPIAHVEAGLRSFNRRMPEEINRVLTDHISDFLFAPTQTGVRNLINEGLPRHKIHNVGDVMFDACVFSASAAREPEWFSILGVKKYSYTLCTVHRAENTNNLEKLRCILVGLATSEFPAIIPMHPRTRAKMSELNLEIPDHIKIVDPVGYLEMAWLESNSRLIATDSGGVQKEAYFHKKFCVTLREETEWVELVESGLNKIVGSDTSLIRETIDNAIPQDFLGNLNFYGDGAAGQKIVSILENQLRN